MKLEALRALQAAAEASHGGLSRRWPALCDAIVANTRLLGCGGGNMPHVSPQKRQSQRQQQPQRHRSEGARWTAQHAQLSSSGGPDGRHDQDSMQSAPKPRVVCGQEANEQCGLQALRLLAAVLAQLCRRASPPQSEQPTANDSTSSSALCAAAEGIGGVDAATAPAAAAAPWPAASGGLNMPSADSPCDAGDSQPEADSDAPSTAIRAWQDASLRILPDAVASPSTQVHAAGIAAIAGLTPELHERLPCATRDLLWRWATEAARDDAAVVRVAAAKAAAAFAAIVVRPGSTAGGPFKLPSLQPPCQCAHTVSRSRLGGRLAEG